MQHAAEIGGNGFKNDNWNQKLLLLGHGQNQYGKRYKGNQRHIIGDKHAEEKAQENEKCRQHPKGMHMG